nr:iron ABC transporter permease [Shimwellia pseudoproteus]
MCYLRCGRYSLLVRPATIAVIALLLVLLALGALVGVASGSLPVPAGAIIHSLFSHQALEGAGQYVVWEIRLPRVLMALLAGGMLGMAGAAMQSVTRNGLADPGLLGVKEGASAVVLVVILHFPALSVVWRPLVGMGGGLLVAGLVMLAAGDVSRPRMVLVGIGCSWLFAAAIGVFITTADVRDVQTALVWMAGSLQGANWPLLLVALCWGGPAVVSLLATTRGADAALLGAHTATGLGVNLRRHCGWQFIAPVLLTATAVSCVGSLGFVGLVAPHMARILVRGGQASLLWASALLGALLVLVTDTLGRLAFAPLQIPAGIVVAGVGGPCFLVLLWLRRDRL